MILDGELLEQMRRRHRAFRVIADTALKLGVRERIAKRFNALPNRIVDVGLAAADVLVQLGRDIARLCLHEIRIVRPRFDQRVLVCRINREDIDEDNRPFARLHLIRKGHFGIEFFELRHVICSFRCYVFLH